MKCNFNFCLYNKDGFCPFIEISISKAGLCSKCLIETIPPNITIFFKKDIASHLINLNSNLRKDE